MDPRRFDLIETMAFDPHEGVSELEAHLARMKSSAGAFGFSFDRHDARNELQAATFRAEASVVRMRLSATGAMAIELRPRTPPAQPVELGLAPSPLEDPLRAHRTCPSHGPRLDHWFDCLYLDPDQCLVEGSFTSLFVPVGERLLTPPSHRVRRGGILRDSLIESGRAQEAELRISELPETFLVGNMALGLVEARLGKEVQA